MVHPAPASLLDYLPAKALVLVDDLDNFQSSVSELEEQSVKFRQESITEGILPDAFPIPYLSLSEVLDSLNGHHWIDMGRTGSVEPSRFAQIFTPGPRFGGRLKPFMEYLQNLHKNGEPVTVVSRQISRLKELWAEVQPQSAEDQPEPEFIEGTLSAGWILSLTEVKPVHLLTDSEVFGWIDPNRDPSIARR